MIYSFDFVGWLWYGGTRGKSGRLLLKAAISSIIVGCKENRSITWEIIYWYIVHNLCFSCHYNWPFWQAGISWYTCWQNARETLSAPQTRLRVSRSYCAAALTSPSGFFQHFLREKNVRSVLSSLVGCEVLKNQQLAKLFSSKLESKNSQFHWRIKSQDVRKIITLLSVRRKQEPQSQLSFIKKSLPGVAYSHLQFSRYFRRRRSRPCYSRSWSLQETWKKF